MKIFLGILVVCFVSSCAYKFKAINLDPLLGLSEEEVKERLGEPTVISKSNDGTIYWVYIPSFKLLPDDRGTIYIEFEENKVKRVKRK